MAKRKDKSSKEYVAAVERFPEGATVDDVAKRLKLPCDRVRRSLQILCNLGWISEKDGRYVQHRG